MKLKQLMQVSALGALMASAGTFAANGSPGNSSNATTQVRADIPGVIAISELGGGDDLLDLGTYDFAAPGDMTAQEDFCVWRNQSGTFEILMEGDGGLTGTNEFRINDGTTELDYTVAYSDDSTAALGAVSAGTAITGQTPTDGNRSCAGAGTRWATLEVTIPQGTAEAAPAGTYTGDLTVTVTVE